MGRSHSVGRAITRYSSRDAIVLATKVYFLMEPGPGGSGLSGRPNMQQADRSLSRLVPGQYDCPWYSRGVAPAAQVGCAAIVALAEVVKAVGVATAIAVVARTPTT